MIDFVTKSIIKTFLYLNIFIYSQHSTYSPDDILISGVVRVILLSLDHDLVVRVVTLKWGHDVLVGVMTS